MYDIPFEFVIDTDSYAGNFERELCAYVTGFWDHETHGGDQAAVFEKEVGDINPFEGYVIQAVTEDDDMPVEAHQCLELTPKKSAVKGAFNSVGIFLQKELPPELIVLIKERAYRFAQQGLIFNRPVKLKILGFRLFKKTVKIEKVNI